MEEKPTATDKLRKDLQDMGYTTAEVGKHTEGYLWLSITEIQSYIEQNYIPRQSVEEMIPECTCDEWHKKVKPDPNCTRCELENYGLIDLLTPKQND